MNDQPSPELGPIRPPSESMSLLVRVSRNCPWNRCAFCAVYKHERFSRRTEEEVIGDIDLLRQAADRVRERAALSGEIGRLSAETCLAILHDPAVPETEKRVALWTHRGAEHVFLQDADSLAMPPERLVRILNRLYERFPSVNRVTTYARSKTLAKRTDDQLAALRAAGLTRIHVGLESGSREVLDFIEKGETPEDHITGCRKAIAAGFEVCCYVMPGLGGRPLSEAHARETARVLREIGPTHVRFRTLGIVPGSPLDERFREGAFDPLEEDEVVAEIRAMLRAMVGIDGEVVSDHDLNLLGDIEGHITRDADALDAACRRFLDLDPAIRDAFVAARRSGYYRSLGAFVADPRAVEAFTALAGELKSAGGGSLIRGIILRLGRRSL